MELLLQYLNWPLEKVVVQTMIQLVTGNFQV